MPSVKLNKEVFEELVGKKLPLEELKDRISMLGTDLDGIEDNIIDVEIFPNRPDLLSEQGFARAFSSFIGVKTGLRDYKVTETSEEVIIDKSLDGIRPFTACALIKNIKFDDEKIKEVIQIQEKLHVTYGRKRKKVAIGLYPMEKIKFPITFKALNPKDIKFQPLESGVEMDGTQILEEHPTGKEYGKLLDGKTKYPVFIDANSQILSMPPIINSHNVGKVTESTTDVFIECSGFDYKVLAKCLNMIVTAMADMGGEICSLKLKYPDKEIISPNLSPEEMDMDVNYINKILGLELTDEEAKTYLEKMGFGYDPKTKKVQIPSYRADILHQIDFAEDIAIAYGYENFDEIIPKVATVGSELKFEIFKKKISDVFIGLGFIEVNTYHLDAMDNQNKRMNIELEPIEILHPATKEYNVLRSWMIPSLMEVFANNKHHEYPQNIFDYGTIFKKDESEETNVKEVQRLAAAICSENADFTKIMQIFDNLCRHLDLEYTIEETEHPSFIPGRVARISINDKKVAFIGEIHPQVLSNWDLDFPVAIFELNLTEIFN